MISNLGRTRRSEGGLLGTADDFVLQILAKVVEVVAVACHTDDEVAVVLRVFLCVAQSVGVYHVELDVVAVHTEVGADEVYQVVATLVRR